MNMMNKIVSDNKTDTTARYERCIENSKRVNWDIEKDIIRGRTFDVSQKFLPDTLSQVEEMTSLTEDDKRFLSQIQGRTYANIFGLVERFINTKIMEIGQDYTFGDQVALEALVRFSQEELKHQELFRKIDKMCGDVMPDGYEFAPQPNDVAHAVLSKSTWAVLALTLDIELFTQAHYRDSIDPTDNLSPLWKDVFLYHWKEESQHAIIDELEWVRHDETITAEERDQGVTEFIELVGAVDGILQAQSQADTNYFITACGRDVSVAEAIEIEKGILGAYRYQYIFSGASHPHFGKVLGSMITPEQGERIHAALGSIK
ncbi:MAG: hypothetical protein HOH18_07475 [Kordiimonadaceae bacterium]|jgi:hypothetical protein|nr:hypothetical protein [Kordiimonadaceae bacterium]MBT6036301.1 hypothetical protein [Kordiimonadaceae bacterium]